MSAAGCPDETTVARFFSTKLDTDERARVLAHLAECVPCCELFGALVTQEPRSTRGREAEEAQRSESVSRYRFERALGFGGNGIVYSAYDPKLDRHVALKLLWAAADDDTERLHREARAMAKLVHPNVVRVYDVGRDRGRTFVAMELGPDRTMRHWMAEKHSWRDVLALFRNAGDGLSAAHRAGLVHRDFKPDNVLVGDGRVLVTDFGVAREVRPGRLLISHAAAAGERVGTPRYMAPEQLRGEDVDARADVYAFAVSLWEALYGSPPGAAAPRSNVPAHVEKALRRAMSHRRRDRQPSIEALLAECSAERSSKGVLFVGLAAMAGVGAAVVAFESRPKMGPMIPIAVPSASVAPSSAAPPPASVATPVESVVAPVVSVSLSANAVAKPARRGSLHGMTLGPFGSRADDARDLLRTNVGKFDPCLMGACVRVNCRFTVARSGAVTDAACVPWPDEGPCTTTRSCLESKIRAVHFPPPDDEGESSLSFADR